MSRTCVAAHFPPRAVLTPRMLSMSAISRSVAPDVRASRIMGRMDAAKRSAFALPAAVPFA